MIRIMRVKEIEKQLKIRPFKPFRLCMSDGNSFDVRHPEMLMTSRTVIALAMYGARASEPEWIVLCDPIHIIRIEPVDNGRSMPRQSSKRR